VISKDQIRQLPVRSVPGLLRHILGVDIRQRGAQGVQADVNMRGSNFEQILVCINGVRINDPQTGHHNMDLPVTLMDIERIEILPGGSSSLYGPAAFCGTINIVTKTPKAKELAIEAQGGSFGLSSQALSLAYPLGLSNHRLSFSRKESSGYRPETDFEVSSLSLNSQRDFSWGALEYLFGYTGKDFGADSFYSDLYSQEEEHTDTRFFNLKAHLRNENLQGQGDFYYRRHSDKFILDRTRPDFYVNYHTSYSYGADLRAWKEFAFGALLAGAEINQEKITSTRLGNHHRDNQALYAQVQSVLEKRALYNLSLRLDHYQTWGWQASPSLSVGYDLKPQLRLKASCGRSFRIPSFTDLYYQSPANIGNEDLTPERAWSSEAALELSAGMLSAELNYFRRWADDLIGWVRSSPGAAWQAENIAEVDTQGLGLELALRLPDKPAIVSEITSGYSYQYLESDSTSLNTKYTLDFLKHHAHLGLSLLLPAELTQSLNLSYKQRIDQRPYFLLDSRISKQIKQDRYDLEIFLDITNLLDASYSEQGDIAMPGRWFIGGLRIKL
jgi:vitamin B12 transporter